MQRHFFLKVFIFLLPVLAVMIGFEYLLRNIPNDYSYKKKYLDDNAEKLEVLFLGNSHIYYGIDPTLIKTASFNAAHIAQPIDFDVEILNKYKKKLTKLKYIILPVDYFSFYNRLENGKEKWRKKNYNIYYGFNKGYNPYNYFEILNGPIRINYNRLELNTALNKPYLYCNDLGWGKYNSKFNKNLVQSARQESALHKAPNSRFYHSSIELLKSLISYSQNIHATLILITCPVHKEYLKNIDSNQMNNTIDVAAYLSQHYSNVLYYNFLNDNSFSDIEFYDADHMNEKGARRFTFKIDSIIQTIENNKKKKEQNSGLD